MAFESAAENLSPDEKRRHRRVRARHGVEHDDAGETTGSAGPAPTDSDDPSISADGRYVAFESYADNLSRRRRQRLHDVFVRDTAMSTTTLVSRRAGPAATGAHDPSISADGRYVAFASDANNLSLDDNNAFTNVFRQDLFGPPPDCSDVAQAVAQGFASVVGLVLQRRRRRSDHALELGVAPRTARSGRSTSPPARSSTRPTQATRAPTPSASVAPTRAAPPTSPRRV